MKMASNAMPQFKLTISEQPVKLHRFRYQKEIKDNRMGSVLHGRSSAKTPVKVLVSCLGETNEPIQLKVVGSTVFEDFAPHPFYLQGDDCSRGIFEKLVTLPKGVLPKVEASLDRIGIICTPKKTAKKKNAVADNDEADTAENYLKRWAQINPFQKTLKGNPFSGKEVNKLRLAFHLLVQVPDTKEWHHVRCEPVATECISDAKIFSALSIDTVIPTTVTKLNQSVWLYMKDQLPGESIKRFTVQIIQANVDLPVTSVKKHLVVFSFSEMPRELIGSGSLEVQLVDNEDGSTSEPVKITLNLPDGETGVPATKKHRSEKSAVPINSIDAYLQAAINIEDGYITTDDVDLLGELVSFGDA